MIIIFVIIVIVIVIISSSIYLRNITNKQPYSDSSKINFGKDDLRKRRGFRFKVSKKRMVEIMITHLIPG